MQQTLFNPQWLKKARKFSPSFSLRFEQSKRSLLIFSSCSILTACASLPRFSSLPDFDKEVSAGLEDISIAAIGLVGVPYRYGGNTPKSGFDCSGLIGYVYKNAANKQMPRTTDEIGKVGQSLGNSTPAPGDLVFFNTQGGPHSHVGIYVGKGRFVHAPSKGGTVRLEKITSSYWSKRYTEARRVVQR
jgi:cell wall-associated NlpC family hydrolase